jgi:phosphatidylinositol glycan class V
MFALLITSGLWGLNPTQDHLVQTFEKADDVQKTVGIPALQVIRNLAISQLILVMLTLTTAHVQIITRMSSAYPIWLWYTASSWQKGNTSLAGSIVKFMVVYSIVQGGLFASFLPPA